MGKNRKHHTSGQKAAIMRENLVDRVSVADLCDKHDISPTVFYGWQKKMFENLGQLFERKNGSRTSTLEKQNQDLKEKISKKDTVIAEIMGDFVEVKKTLGGRS